jgi:hypothetical protein
MTDGWCQKRFAAATSEVLPDAPMSLTTALKETLGSCPRGWKRQQGATDGAVYTLGALTASPLNDRV